MEHDKQLEGLDQIEVENFALFDQKISDHIYRIREPVECLLCRFGLWIRGKISTG